ncbi:MAG: hypothetical protein U1F08_09195 [Steroidobacteraceae bacterium]
MARARDDGQGGPGGGRAGEGLLGGSVRRDLADLNLCHLEFALDEPDPQDPLACWSPAVLGEIRAAGRDVLARMAASPYSLFEIRLPATAAGAAATGHVRDAAAGTQPRPPRSVEFARAALFAAWRMADRAPLAARIVFGLTPLEELCLNELCPSRVAALANDPEVVRARWPDRPRLWAMLRTAAESGRPAALQWIHCLGVSLTERRDRVPSGHGGPRGRPGR